MVLENHEKAVPFIQIAREAENSMKRILFIKQMATPPLKRREDVDEAHPNSMHR